MAVTDIPVPDDSAIRSISVYSNEAWAGGVLTVTPTIDGVAISDGGTTLDATNTQINTKLYEPSPSTFVPAGHVFGAHIATSAAWAPTTADITVLVVVQVTGDY